ncbi:MAG: VOC family protein, partial [Gimesia chilikensis]
TPVSIHLQVEDVDAVFNQAIEAGATLIMPVMEMFWGDRYGQVDDPFGHRWSVATHVRDLSFEEIQAGMQAMFEQNQNG